MTQKDFAEKAVRDIRRKTRQKLNMKTPPTELAEGVHFIWSTRPGSLAGFARFALAEQSSAANR